jgi:hypothetical protein
MAKGDPEELDDELDAPDPQSDEEVEDDAIDDADQEADEPQADDGSPDLAAQTEQDRQPQDRDQQSERRPSRENERVRSLREQVKERDQRLAETNRRLDEIIRGQAQPRQTGETPEQRAMRHATMTPLEIMDEKLRESEQRVSAQNQAMTMHQVELSDKTAFQAKVAVDPFYAKWAPKVEALRAEYAAKGFPMIEREVAFSFVLGEAMKQQRNSKEGKREVRQAQQRVNNQRVRPANSGSDTQAQRRPRDSVERRLENIQI